MAGKSRDIGARGRVVVAALSVGAAGVLAGWMAASDHTATTATTTGGTSASSAGSSSSVEQRRGGRPRVLRRRPAAPRRRVPDRRRADRTGGVFAASGAHRRELMSAHFWWYTARAGGLVAWGLVLASCAWGLMLALHVKVLGIRPTAAWTLSLHRWLAALAVTFTAVHLVGARRRQLHPLRARRRARAVRDVVASGRGRVGHHRDVSARHDSDHVVAPRPSLATHLAQHPPRAATCCSAPPRSTCSPRAPTAPP